MTKLHVSGNRVVLVLLVAIAFAMAGCAKRTITIGLRPEYPKSLKQVVYGGFIGELSVDMFAQVDTTQPTFKWDAFPRKKELESEKQELREELSRITNVTYDLEIFKAENDYPAELIYSKQGLSEPFHRLETPLDTCARYFWTVRARFKLDNKTRVTGWSVRLTPGSTTINAWFSPYAPNPDIYLFQTPCPHPQS